MPTEAEKEIMHKTSLSIPIDEKLKIYIFIPSRNATEINLEVKPEGKTATYGIEVRVTEEELKNLPWEMFSKQYLKGAFEHLRNTLFPAEEVYK